MCIPQFRVDILQNNSIILQRIHHLNSADYISAHTLNSIISQEVMPATKLTPAWMKLTPAQQIKEWTKLKPSLQNRKVNFHIDNECHFSSKRPVYLIRSYYLGTLPDDTWQYHFEDYGYASHNDTLWNKKGMNNYSYPYYSETTRLCDDKNSDGSVNEAKLDDCVNNKNSPYLHKAVGPLNKFSLSNLGISKKVTLTDFNGKEKVYTNVLSSMYQHFPVAAGTTDITLILTNKAGVAGACALSSIQEEIK